MRVVYPVCCGVDVHKSFLVATIITTHNNHVEPTYQQRRFSTFHRSLLEFREWLVDNQCFHVCMESTGKYWIPVFNVLEDFVQVTLANPKWVSAVKGNKDDVKDSKWIGDLFRLGLVPGSFIPDKEIRVLRELTRYRAKLVACKASEKSLSERIDRMQSVLRFGRQQHVRKVRNSHCQPFGQRTIFRCRTMYESTARCNAQKG